MIVVPAIILSIILLLFQFFIFFSKVPAFWVKQQRPKDLTFAARLLKIFGLIEGQ